MASICHEIQNAVATSPSAIEAIFSLLHFLSATLSQKMAAIFWSMWKHRNVKVWEDITETCATVVERARSMVEDWKLVNVPCANGQAAPTANHITTVNHVTLAVTTTIQVRWQPPAQGQLKCNIDAAFSNHRNRTGIGICIRDEGGVFVLAKTISFVGVYSVDIGEALSLYHALQWVNDMQFDNIDFEVDSKTTKDVVYSDREDISKFGSIITAS